MRAGEGLAAPRLLAAAALLFRRLSRAAYALSLLHLLPHLSVHGSFFRFLCPSRHPSHQRYRDADALNKAAEQLLGRIQDAQNKQEVRWTGALAARHFMDAKRLPPRHVVKPPTPGQADYEQAREAVSDIYRNIHVLEVQGSQGEYASVQDDEVRRLRQAGLRWQPARRKGESGTAQSPLGFWTRLLRSSST